MNAQQLSGIAKPLIAALVAFLAAKGFLFSADNWNIIITSLVAAGLAAWSGWQHTDTNLVKSVDAIAQQPGSAVKAVITEGTEAGKEMAASLPGNTTVVAGTPAAIRAAQ